MGTVILCTAESLIQPIYAALICIYIYASLPIHAMREYLTIKHILASPQRSPTPTCDSPPRARYTTRGAVNESHTDHRAPFPPHRGSRHSCWGQELYRVSLLLLHSLPEISGYQGRRIMLSTDAIESTRSGPRPPSHHCAQEQTKVKVTGTHLFSKHPDPLDRHLTL